MEQFSRRSRMRCTHTGRRLELSKRDLEIFKLLCRYRYLRSTYLHAFVGGASTTRFKERLGDLFHEGYIDRPAQQWQFADARCQPAIYEIGSGAIRTLDEAGGADEPCTFLSSSAHRQFQHSLLICECLASIELATFREGSGARFIAWPEILARAPQTTRNSSNPSRLNVEENAVVVPDGVFGLEYLASGTPSYRFFALEVDRGTMPVVRSDRRQSSYLAKLETYQRAIARQRHRDYWGVPNLLVLTVTQAQSRKQEIMSRAQSVLDECPAFLFKALGDTRKPATDLLFEEWQRAGAVPLRIDLCR